VIDCFVRTAARRAPTGSRAWRFVPTGSVLGELAKLAGGCRGTLKHIRLLGFIVGVTFIAYARSCTVPFQFDDWTQIAENHAVYDPSLTSIVYRARAFPSASTDLIL
jgi:hypothetical protein